MSSTTVSHSPTATMALSSSLNTHLPSRSQPNSIPKILVNSNSCLTLKPKNHTILLVSTWATDNGSGGAAVIVEEENRAVSEAEKPKIVELLGSNGSSPVAAPVPGPVAAAKFIDQRWVNGNWDLAQFQKNEKTDWDAVIDAEARRRKWLEIHPESSSNEEPVLFKTSDVPWWVWIKRYHLPEAELLNGRAAMIGFAMAYLVDSLTGLGVVDQMNNFLCKSLLFVAVSGVLLIRKNEDIDVLKKLFEESTFYDKQWQATWKDQNRKD